MSSAPRAPHALHISRYHALLKRVAAVDHDARFPTPASKAARRAVLRAELAAAGGLAAYQAASRAGEAAGGAFDASRWVLAELPRAAGDRSAPLRLLDVGAIVARFPEAVPGCGLRLRPRSIDLASDDPAVEQADFFDVAAAAAAAGDTFDVIVLSLVLNFVATPARRGEMLRRAREICADRGLLFLVLPLASVANSRYCDAARIDAVLRAVGWRVVMQSTSAKLFSVVCEKAPPAPGAAEVVALSKRAVVRSGSDRNNFCVLLPAESPPSSIKKEKVEKKDGAERAGRGGGKKAKHGAETRKGAALRQPQGVSKNALQTTSNQRKRARRKAKQAAKAI